MVYELVSYYILGTDLLW